MPGKKEEVGGKGKREKVFEKNSFSTVKGIADQ